MGDSKRPVLLLNWNYYRADITEPLLQLAEQFELVFLHDYAPSDKTGCVQEFTRIFWNNYASPYDLLNEIKPAKIVFYDCESFHQVGLVVAARNKGIRTFVLEHGLRGGYEVEIEKQKYYHSLKNPVTVYHHPVSGVSTISHRNLTLLFYLRALKFRDILSLPCVFKFIYSRKKYGLTYGLNRVKNKFRYADFYINFTEKNASYIMVRDGVPLNRFRLCGNPSFDNFFAKAKKFVPSMEEKYILLLDAPFSDTDVFGMTKEDKNSFLIKLNDFAISKGMKLKVKLHPLSYSSDYFFRHDNISYHRAEDIVPLIFNSSACVHVHMSSLMPLAMLYKPYLFFNTYPEYNIDIAELNIPSYNYYDFKKEALSIRELDENSKQRIVKDYLYDTDGRAIERIQNVLTGK